MNGNHQSNGYSYAQHPSGFHSHPAQKANSDNNYSSVNEFDLFLPSVDKVDSSGLFLDDHIVGTVGSGNYGVNPYQRGDFQAIFDSFHGENNGITSSQHSRQLGSITDEIQKNKGSAAAKRTQKRVTGPKQTKKALGTEITPDNVAAAGTAVKRNTKTKKRGSSESIDMMLPSSPSGTPSSDEGDDNGEGDGAGNDDEKKNKRRRQIAAASRASRARRKRELEDLREENRRLREERSQFLSKIGDLQMKVEALRERGSTDMRIENELLRAQLEEHKRFVSCFKRLCDGAPTSLNARHLMYKQGSDAAQAHVLSLISQSQADDWQEALLPENLNLSYQNFCMYYNYKIEHNDGTESELGSNGSISHQGGGKTKRRLNVRVDALFPATDASNIAEFFWNSLIMTDFQNRLHGVKGVELTQLADDMPDKDTKMIYYREKHAPPKKDVDWAIICNRRRRDLAKSTLAPPNKKGVKPQLGRASTIVTAMSTTQQSVTPQFDNADRITSLFVQGCVTWNVGGDSRACIVLSFPDDFKIKAIEGFSDIIDENGMIAKKFVHLLQSVIQIINEHSAEVGSSTAMSI